MRDWADVAEGYRRSFARACAGATGPLLAATNDQRGHSDDVVRHLDHRGDDLGLAICKRTQGQQLPDTQVAGSNVLPGFATIR